MAFDSIELCSEEAEVCFGLEQNAARTEAVIWAPGRGVPSCCLKSHPAIKECPVLSEGVCLDPEGGREEREETHSGR